MTEPTNQDAETTNSWASRWQNTKVAFGNIPGAFRLVWQAHRAATISMIGVSVLFALLPAAKAWVAKLIIDTIVEALGNRLPIETGLQAVMPYLLLEFVLFALTTLLNQFRSYLDHVINARLGHYIHVSIIRKALSLSMHYFENAAFYDKLQNAQTEANWRPLGIVNSSFLLFQDLITLLSLGILLATFGPVVALLLFGAVIPSFVAQLKYSKLYFRLLTWHAPEFRRKAYFEHLLTHDGTMKEIKLFNLGEPLLSRYNTLFWRFYNEDMGLARRRTIMSSLWSLLATACYYGAYGWTVYEALKGTITLGDLTLYLSVLRQSQGSFQAVFFNIGHIYESSLFMSNLFSFLNMPASEEPSTGAPPVPPVIRQGVEFRNVSFRYPDRPEWAIHNLNLHIRPGEKLALVGANGAGKTTLVKLLTRLYEPTEGQILLDGVDLRDYDLGSLRERIGVIFQDFAQYQLTARENIGFGRIQAMGDQLLIEQAARRGGADTVIADLADGYDTMLGRWFDKGHELSGGQWQKIALSRAFMRDGAVLVLDEPTSALDAEREYEIFQRFRELTDGRMAVLISHRFSTVRMADRIAVLEGGQIIELGTHHELLSQNGTYARLFNLQAAGYR